MYILTLDMKQYDCPFINSSDDLEVSYYMTYWDFQADKLINRGYIFASDNEELQNSIELITKQPKFLKLDVLSREGNIALVRTEIDFTNAMSIIRKNHGYIVGPFFVKNGRELWQVGFDTIQDVNSALSELDKKNEFEIKNQHKITIEEFSKIMSSLPPLIDLIKALDGLTTTEKMVLQAAVRYGFFDDPKKIHIESLSQRIKLSKGSFSRKLRKAEKKILPIICKILSYGENKL